MSTTIDSLDIQITTSAGQSAANIEKLANSLEKLRANSKLTTVTNNLGKLKTALDGLNSTSGAVSNLNKLSAAMNGLASLPKLAGLTSAMNALKKIPDVMNGLDANKLDEFRKKMQKLADALSPVATKINTISQGFSKLPSRISSAVSATNRMTTASHNSKKGFDMSSVGLMALISNYGTLISTINQVIQVMAAALSQAIEWDGIQFRFGRAFGEDAEETYAYIQKINEALGINIQEFMQYSSLYGSLLSGFGMAQEKITAISVGLTELSYDIWAAYNDRFKSLESASEAVRSAITGEIEPIRNAGIALTEASLQEFINQTHLAGVSIEKLTEAQKAEVRYAAMVNAAMNQGIVGTYAREMQTAEGAVRSLSQSFKGLVQALGSLFIPLLQMVVPYVTAFVELITEAVFWVAKLFGIPIQKIDWGTPTKGVGGIAEGAKDATKGLDSASKAAKKLKQYTMGFDELNVISPDTGSDASGSGGAGAGDSGWGAGLDLKSLWDDSVFDEASKKVDEIKQKILDFVDKWKWAFAIAGAVMTAFAGHKLWTMFTKTALFGGLKKVIDTLKTFFALLKGGSPLGDTLAATFPKLANAFNKVKTAVSVFVSGLTGGTILTIVAVITAIASVVYFLYENWEKVTEAVKNFFKENIAPKLEKIGEHFSDIKEAVGPIYESVKKFFQDIDWSKLDWIGKIFETIGGIIFSVVGGVIATAFNMLVGMIENIIQVFTGLVQITSGVIQFIVALFKGDFQGIIGATKLIADGIKNLWDGLVEFVIDIVKDFVKGIVSWFANLANELDIFSENTKRVFKQLWSDVKSWWNTNVQPKFTKQYWKSKFETVRSGIQEKLAEVKTAISEKWNDVKNWYNQTVAPKLTAEYWKTKFDGIKSGLKAKLDEAWDAVKDFFSVEKWKSIVEDAVKAIKNNFTMPSLPKIKLDVTWDTNVGPLKKAVYEALGLSGWPNLKWTAYATGGFPKMGEAFIAREAGPELVGRIGNRSAVANNDQIITAVSQGVYSAVVSAMSETQGNSGGTQPVVVYLDGKQIYSNVKRTESRRGIDLMGNQVGYVY